MKSILYLTILLSMGLSSGHAHADKSPIHIKADRMSSIERTNSVVFTGNVDTKQGDIRIRSDEMTVYYTQKQKDQKEIKFNRQVEKLLCTGNVEITRGEWLGMAKTLLYLSEKRQIILTENAKAWLDQDMISGDKIIYYIDEGRSEVVGKASTTVENAKKDNQQSSRVDITILPK